MATSQKVSLGLDFGTESVRALLVDLEGSELGSAVVAYAHGQILGALPTGEKLPPAFALQHPMDWIESAGEAVSRACQQGSVSGEEVIGLGVDFTSCTMLPVLADGAPLCLRDDLAIRPFAWPKLWKHHGALAQTERLNQLATERLEPWLGRYGGIVGLEWFFPKILETVEGDPPIADATEVWLEAGDWFVWQCTGGSAEDLPRSTCQAGYKALWSRANGYPSLDFFTALHPGMADVIKNKLPGRFCAPGTMAGRLTAEMAGRMGLKEGTPVSAAIIDAHAGVPGVGAGEEGALVMVMGTSSCHMLNAREEHLVPGVAGVVEDGILPGFYGYETGQAAVGDAFDWARRLTGREDFEELTRKAEPLPPGSDGVLCLDWLNGCRTPWMDGSLRGAFTGFHLGHGPEHLYRALLEASAFGLRWIVDLLREHAVPVNRFVATGGLPHYNPLLMQIYADVLEEVIEIHPSQQGPALGAAVLGAMAAGQSVTGFADPQEAIGAMASPRPGRSPESLSRVEPRTLSSRQYQPLYGRYREWADQMRAFSRQE